MVIYGGSWILWELLELSWSCGNYRNINISFIYFMHLKILEGRAGFDSKVAGIFRSVWNIWVTYSLNDIKFFTWLLLELQECVRLSQFVNYLNQLEQKEIT